MQKVVAAIIVVLFLLDGATAFARGGGGGKSGGHSSGGHRHSSGSKRSGGGTSNSKTHVRSYTKKDGTHVQEHNRTNADGTKTNNWSTKGNVNPETGKPGTRDL